MTSRCFWQNYFRLAKMKTANEKRLFEDLVAPSGVRINGDRPCDIQVLRSEFYRRVITGGSRALGESYMDGWWRCGALDQFFNRVLRTRLDKRVKKTCAWLGAIIRAKLLNTQGRSRAYSIGRRHYDIGNRLFAAMLDERMNYSCAYWEGAQNLDQAQEAKLELICRKLMLRPGMTILDIGCGWGGFARWVAEKHGAVVRGITVSKEQVRFATNYCKGYNVKIELRDYRDITETYDRIVSIGMFEHVGAKNYRTYMKVVRRALNPDGIFLLHTIAGNTSTFTTDPWIGEYIFPNSMLPSALQIAAAAEGLLILEDWHSFGQHYDPTLMAWYRNFKTNWPQIKELYDERFNRMWTYYLLSSAGSFRSRRNQLWQIVFSKTGIMGGYNIALSFCGYFRPEAVLLICALLFILRAVTRRGILLKELSYKKIAICLCPSKWPGCL